MQDNWYADNRDLVKWGALLHLARAQRIPRILQVALYRGKEPTAFLAISSGLEAPTLEPLPKEVLKHFRDLTDIQRLAVTTKTRIDIERSPFQWTSEFYSAKEFRKNYFAQVCTTISTPRDEPLLVFLDPDTGIAPPGKARYEHVTSSELNDVFRALQKGDTLALYQHARRGERYWIENTRKAFASALNMSEHMVTTITCKSVAHDVVLFAVQQANRRQ